MSTNATLTGRQLPAVWTFGAGHEGEGVEGQRQLAAVWTFGAGHEGEGQNEPF